jgi:hypothetical protein
MQSPEATRSCHFKRLKCFALRVTVWSWSPAVNFTVFISQHLSQRVVANGILSEAGIAICNAPFCSR